MAKRISPTPSGTVEGGSVFPLASNVEYQQSVQPVTIVSSLDTKGKQQPFTVAPDVNVINSFSNQGDSVSLTNNAIGKSKIEKSEICFLSQNLGFKNFIFKY